MKIHKKTAFLIFTLYSCYTTAGSMGDTCEKDNVSTPCAERTWGLGASALYLKPSVANSGQPGSYITTSPGYRHLITFSQDWDFGYQVEASYHFSKGSDINLNWYHFNNSSSDQVTAAIAPSGVTWGGLVKSSPTWNAVNLEWGQGIELGSSRNFRVHGGLGYAQIKTDVETSRPVNSVIRDRSSYYNGVGPRVGLDANFFLTSHWNIYAKAATALLVGKKGFTDKLNFIPIVYDISATSIVPEIESKLGFQYAVDFGARGLLAFDLNWMFIYYFDAEIYEHQLGQNYEIKDAGFGLQGLSFGLKWRGNLV